MNQTVLLFCHTYLGCCVVQRMYLTLPQQPRSKGLWPLRNLPVTWWRNKWGTNWWNPTMHTSCQYRARNDANWWNPTMHASCPYRAQNGANWWNPTMHASCQYRAQNDANWWNPTMHTSCPYRARNGDRYGRQCDQNGSTGNQKFWSSR